MLSFFSDSECSSSKDVVARQRDEEDKESDDEMQADDFAEQYRKKQEAMLAELTSIYNAKNELSNQLSSLVTSEPGLVTPEQPSLREQRL